jgi:hypothetical protein
MINIADLSEQNVFFDYARAFAILVLPLLLSKL